MTTTENEAMPDYSVSYAVSSQSYEEISLIAQVDGSIVAQGIKTAVGSYLAKIPGLVELGASTPSSTEMDEWVAGQDEALLKSAVPLSVDRKQRTFSRFVPAEGFALKTLTRARMKYHEPDLLELMDRFAQSYRVVMDDLLMQKLKREYPEMTPVQLETFEQMRGKVVYMRNPDRAIGYLDWPKINKVREKHTGFFIDEAVLAYSSARQQDTGFVRERSDLIERRRRLFAPLPGGA